MLEKHLARKEYRRRLKDEIKDYEELRDSIRKIKVKEASAKKSESERKISVGLKLQKIDSAKNIGKETAGQQGLGKDAPEMQESKEVKLV